MRQVQCVPTIFVTEEPTTFVTEIKETYFEIYNYQESSLLYLPL